MARETHNLEIRRFNSATATNTFMKKLLKQFFDIYDPATIGLGLLAAAALAAMMMLPWLVDEAEVLGK